MKVTYNWLQDFVEIKITPKALADKLTMAGLEVTSLQEQEGDFVFEVEVTSNRPDCLSVIGIAREVAAITGKKLKTSVSRKSQAKDKAASRGGSDNTKQLSINIEDKKDCSLYTARVIHGVMVSSSPQWMQKRLAMVGCRSVNNVVDTTNYILFTYGEPLHAFDLDKLQGVPRDTSAGGTLEIGVRRAKAAEKITTIDGIERTLDADMLVISDTQKAIAVAGVMGGQDSEVTLATKNILLEAAVFNPIIVRRGRRELGVQSESSYRFERGIDPEIVETASMQATALIQELAGGKCFLSKTAGSTEAKKSRVALDTEAVRKFLGVDIAGPKIKKMLVALGFQVKEKTKNTLSVQAPSYRPDVNTGIDLIEEVARIYGFDAVPNSLPAVKPRVARNEKRETIHLIKKILTGLGLNEVITYSLMDQAKLQGFAALDSAIEIQNPMSKEQKILRPTLMPGLLNCVALNLNQKQDYIYIFEIASAYTRNNEEVKEELTLGIAACGNKSLLLGQGLVREEIGVLHLKGTLETLLMRLGIIEYSLQQGPGADRIEVCVAKQAIGTIRQFANSVLDNFGIKNKKVYGLEISLDKLSAYINRKKKFSALPIYPAVTRDFSLILHKGVRVDDILGKIKENAGGLLQELKILDCYKGKQIPPGCRGLTVSCLYRSTERTLTEAEIDVIQAKVSEVLVRELGLKMRA